MAFQKQLASRCLRPVGVRAFAAKAAAADHAPPLKLYGLYARYANAAYTAASKAGQLEAVERDLLAFKHVMSNNAALGALLGNPTVTRDAKVGLINQAFDGKSKTSPVSKNLLVTMAGNARLGDAPKVIDCYASLLKAKRGEVDAVVTTAEPLTAAQKKTLTAALKGQVGPKETVLLETKVNPALVGGLTVQIGDKFLDLSIASKINDISALMMQAAADKE